MLRFKYVRWSNFLSTGDKFTEIQLDKTPTTLIVGSNGAGKSTLLDALSFALFGKAHRDIKKNQLINSVNGKKTVVEVEFEVGGSYFKIVRGIKPNKFEIWQNDNQINQDSNARNFQKYLESNILKLNHKSFHQIVVLGSSSFIPFMQLPAQGRREIIEDLLDINIFSKMNFLLKERIAILKEESRDLNYQYDLVKNKIKLQVDNIEYIEELIEKERKSKGAELQAKRDRVAALKDELDELGHDLEDRIVETQSHLSGVQGTMHDFVHMKRTASSDMKKLMAEAKFFQDNDNCPTCTQPIHSDLKKHKLLDIKKQGTVLDDTKRSLQEEIDKFEKTVNEWEAKENALRAAHNNYNMKSRYIDDLYEDMQKTDVVIDTSSLNRAQDELSNLQEQRDLLFDKKAALQERGAYAMAMTEMLKDSGIKTKIIKQYLPVMNKLINQYLQILDFFVSFNINENFDEVIKSRYRDEFNYASFSEGEKQRIDLALLFTWRQIARMKNSVSTNLLILDETFDSSLDGDGVGNLSKILHTLNADTNTIIISHKRDELDGKFKSTIEFVKEGNFSTIKKV